MTMERRNLIRDVDYKLLLNIFVLCAFGLVVLKSAALSLDNTSRIMRAQHVATGLGFFMMFFLMIVDYRHWKVVYKLIYLVSILLLVFTLIKGIGPGGVRSWIVIGNRFSFQPSEFVKIAYIICMAAMLEDVGDDLNKPLVLVRVLVFTFLPIVLILLQPDTGTAIVYMFIAAIMLFIAGISWKYIFIAIGVFILLVPIIWLRLINYQQDRFFDFLNPMNDPLGSGYQYLHGQIAIGSGKFFGKGLYQGTQNMFNFIPEKQNDFIFPVLVEELGFVGGMALILLYLFMLFRMYNISKESVDRYGAYMVMGIAGMFLFHIWENIGMTLGVMPITGIPLPFFSSGGTFQLTSLILIGLVLSVAAHRHIKYF